MDMKTAKQILNENGFLLEDTKSLVGKFWSAKKNGETLSKEDAEALLNAPDFDDLVNPKYKNYILSVCRKTLGIAKPEKPTEEKPKEVVKEEPKEQKNYKELGKLLYDKSTKSFDIIYKIMSNNAKTKMQMFDEIMLTAKTAEAQSNLYSMWCKEEGTDNQLTM